MKLFQKNNNCRNFYVKKEGENSINVMNDLKDYSSSYDIILDQLIYINFSIKIINKIQFASIFLNDKIILPLIIMCIPITMALSKLSHKKLRFLYINFSVFLY